MLSSNFSHLVTWVFGVTILVVSISTPQNVAANGANQSARFAEAATNEPGDSEGQNQNVAGISKAQAERLATGGQIKLRFENREKLKRSRASLAGMMGQRAVEDIVSHLNKQIALPFDINASFIKCNEAEAFYDQYTQEIVICNELLERYYRLFSRQLRNNTARNESTKGATVSLFLHELGHALINVWNLPITGKEEDAADQFATLMMINGLLDGERMALNGARIFKLYARQNHGKKKFYWDSHSFDEQRFYDTICLVYGHKPEKYDYLIENGTLPYKRALRCEDDYPRVKESWQTLLAPFSKRETLLFVNDAVNPMPKPYLWPRQSAHLTSLFAVQR